MRKISKYKVNNYISGYWEQISKSEPSWKAYQLGIAQGLFLYYQAVKEMVGEETADAMSKEMTTGKEEYHSILKTLIVLENKGTEKIDRIMELFSEKKKEDALSDEELKLVEALTAYLYKNNT